MLQKILQKRPWKMVTLNWPTTKGKLFICFLWDTTEVPALRLVQPQNQKFTKGTKIKISLLSAWTYGMVLRQVHALTKPEPVSPIPSV